MAKRDRYDIYFRPRADLSADNTPYGGNFNAAYGVARRALRDAMEATTCKAAIRHLMRAETASVAASNYAEAKESRAARTLQLRVSDFAKKIAESGQCACSARKGR